jgi:hypothetical protein
MHEGELLFSIWPPVKVSSPEKLTKAAGIKGKLGTWHRNGFFQVTLNGHPLYTFSIDRHPRAAMGEGIHGFGGTWHVLRPAGSSAKPVNQPPMTTSTSSTTSTTSTSTTPCLYPPC